MLEVHREFIAQIEACIRGKCWRSHERNFTYFLKDGNKLKAQSDEIDELERNLSLRDSVRIVNQFLCYRTELCIYHRINLLPLFFMWSQVWKFPFSCSAGVTFLFEWMEATLQNCVTFICKLAYLVEVLCYKPEGCGFIGFYSWPNPPSRNMALGSTQPLTEMSTSNLAKGVKGGRCLRLTNLPQSVSRLSRENVGASTSDNPMSLHGPLQE
jgi:hypothetical protein